MLLSLLKNGDTVTPSGVRDQVQSLCTLMLLVFIRKLCNGDTVVDDEDDDDAVADDDDAEMKMTLVYFFCP